MQISMFQQDVVHPVSSRRSPPQLLKWVGNKHRFAATIVSSFPNSIGTYFEPFLGSGAVLGTLAPPNAIGSDCFGPLVEIWTALKEHPEDLKEWYSERWNQMKGLGKIDGYEAVKASYNRGPNGPDLVFLSRTCYGGVVRFRKADGYMSTPCGIHEPISPDSFARRVDEWHRRTSGASFLSTDYASAMAEARPGDVVYCDPPYSHSQAILYGAQDFSIKGLLLEIERCKTRGVSVALSIDGTKKSGDVICDVPVPARLFETEILIDCGRSMLKRFQMDGRSLERERVADRLLLTYPA